MVLDVVVVIYNERIEETPLVHKNKLLDEVNHIIYCDNSTNDDIKKHNCRVSANSPHVKYLDMGGNVGLPKAYNAAVQISTADYLCILDDDTTMPAEYFARVRQYLENSEADILLPVVYSQDGSMLSPSKKGPVDVSSFRTVREIAAPFSAINSGMILRRQFATKCKYDERLFLDKVDTRFMDQAVANQACIIVMKDQVLHQNFSGLSDNVNAAKHRLPIQEKDCYTYARISNNYMLLIKYHVIFPLLKLKLVMKSFHNS